MTIISDRDKEGNFVDAAKAWNEEKIEALLLKYNPNGKLWYSSSRKKQEDTSEEKGL